MGPNLSCNPVLVLAFVPSHTNPGLGHVICLGQWIALHLKQRDSGQQICLSIPLYKLCQMIVLSQQFQGQLSIQRQLTGMHSITDNTHETFILHYCIILYKVNQNDHFKMEIKSCDSLYKAFQSLPHCSSVKIQSTPGLQALDNWPLPLVQSYHYLITPPSQESHCGHRGLLRIFPESHCTGCSLNLGCVYATACPTAPTLNIVNSKLS